MKRIISFLLIIILIIMGCSKKAKKEEVPEEGKEKVTIQVYYTQPAPFSMILSDLEKLGTVNYHRILKNRKPGNPKSLDKIAFCLGAGVADALLGVKGKNKNEIMNITKEMVNYAEVLGVSKSFLKLSDSVKVFLEQDEWVQIEKKLEDYKSTILDELYNLESFDSVILIHYGGWIKGLQDVTQLIMTDLKGDKEATKTLANITVVIALLHDLPNLFDKNVVKQPYFQKSLVDLSSIKDIIFSSEDGCFDKLQVEKLNQLATEIVENFMN